MSGIAIAVAALKTITALRPDLGWPDMRVYPAYPPQNAGMPYIVVVRISEQEEKILAGSSNWPVSRISFVIVTAGDVKTLERIGTALVGSRLVPGLKDIHNATLAGCEATFSKEGTDETSPPATETLPTGFAAGVQRTIDFYIRWRTIVAP